MPQVAIIGFASLLFLAEHFGNCIWDSEASLTKDHISRALAFTVEQDACLTVSFLADHDKQLYPSLALFLV